MVPWKKLSPMPANGPIRLVLIMEIDSVWNSPSSEFAFCSSMEAARPMINGVSCGVQLKNSICR